MRSIWHALSKTQRVALWRNNVGYDGEHKVRYGLGVGSPDLVGIVDGRFLGLEVKTATGRVSSEQRAWHEHARKHGALIHVVRTVEEALECLQ